MRKGTWSAAAVIAIAIIASPTVRAADTQVRIVEGNQSDINTWKFEPAQITIPVGSTVTWRNDGTLDHTATADNNAFDSGNLSPGKDFKFTFSTPGEFTYNCQPHPFMTGVVKVTGAASTPTTAAPTTTTAAAPGGATTTTTAKGAQASSTTTTTRPGAGASAGPTTTTTAGLGVTSTTQAASTTPTSAPETGDVTSTTVAAGTDAHGGEESAAETPGNEGGSDKETNPVAVGVAGILTAALTAISLKLLTGKP